MIVSKYFSQGQLKGLAKAGDILLPGTDTSPSFSQTGCIAHMDKMAAYLSEDDYGGLKMLLSLFQWMPRWKIRLLFKLCDQGHRFPGFLGAGLRMLEIGVKGAVFSPYYANLTGPGYEGKKVHDAIDWHPKLVLKEDELPEKAMAVNLDDPTPADITAVYDRARAAQADIRDWGVKKRVEFISALKAVILEHQEYILDRLQADTGKSRFDAITAEIFGTLDFLDYLEKNAVKSLKDRKVATPFALMGKRSKVYFEPLGTALLISPWNYPFYQAIVPITQAFIAGNAVVFKPSSATPLKGLVEELLAKAGFKAGWVQIVYGNGSKVGDALVDGKPDKIFLIGSQAVGKRVMAKAAQHLIPVELELGGKDPMVVFDDVNIDRAAAGAVWGAFTTTGQSCTSVERLFVHETVYDDFKETLIRETLKLVQARDTDGSADIGPMCTQGQVETIAAQVADAIYTGNVSINNVMLTEGNHALPFGGVGKSGFGRYKGEFGFYAFANIKAVLIDKDSAKMEANWFPYTVKKYGIFSDLTSALYSPGKIMGLVKGAYHGLRLETYVKKLAKKGRN